MSDRAGEGMSELRRQVLELVRRKGLRRSEVAFRLASGEESFDYVDGKYAVSHGPDLDVAARAIVELAEGRGITFDTVGGLTMGADALTHAVALVAGVDWFTVRKERKDHGQTALVEGAGVEGTRALILDDVVTTGASIAKAVDATVEGGGTAVLAVALVDRSGRTTPLLESKGVPFEPLLTWEDLGIAPVGGGRVPA